MQYSSRPTFLFFLFVTTCSIKGNNIADFFLFTTQLSQLNQLEKQLTKSVDAILNAYTYPFIHPQQAVNQPRAAGEEAARQLKDTIDHTLTKNVTQQYKNDFQTNFEPQVEAIRKNLGKLGNQFAELSKNIDNELGLFAINFFSFNLNSHTAQQTLLKSAQAFKALVGTHYNDIKYKEIQNRVRNFAESLELLANRPSKLKEYLASSQKSSDTQAVATKEQRQIAYQNELFTLLKLYALSPYDTVDDAINYYEIISFIKITDLPESQKLTSLLATIRDIRSKFIVMLEKLTFATQITIAKLLQNPELKDQLITLSNATKTWRANTVDAIQDIASSNFFDPIKNQWLELVQNKPISLGTTAIDARTAELKKELDNNVNLLNLFFTLYLDPEVIKNKKANDYLTKSTQNKIAKLAESTLDEYSEHRKDLLSLGHKIPDYSSVYAQYLKLLSQLATQDVRLFIIPHLDVFNKVAGEDVEDVDWDAKDLRAIKDLNSFIIEHFDPTNNKFGSGTLEQFKKVYQAYLTSGRTKPYYDQSYKAWANEAQKSLS